MAKDLLQNNIANFQQFFTQESLPVVTEREIQSGHQFQLNDGQNKISVSLYSTGKVLIQGKDCELKARIERWWDEQSLLLQNNFPSGSTGVENPRTDSTAKFIVGVHDFDTVKELLLESGIQNNLNDVLGVSQQVFRITFRDDYHQVVVTLYQTGTLLVQGKVGELFGKVCEILETILPQSFVERGTRYIPDTNRAVVSEYMSRPQVKQGADDWVTNQLSTDVFDFLNESDQKLYRSGAGLLLSVKQLDLTLSDYSILVMPFAKVYEGFVIQLALELGISKQDDIKNDPDNMKAGRYLEKIRKKIMEERAIQLRHGGLATSLEAAWQNIRNRVMHSDPLNPSSYDLLTHADAHIGSINDAMRRGHKTLIVDRILKF